MNYKQDHIPKSAKRRPGTALKPQFLTIHSTGNPSSTARNERGWLTNPSNNRTASWHIVVDEREAIEAIPLNEVAFHAGTAAGNNTSIGLEICESGNREKTLAHAAEVAASILKKYGWGVDRLRRHYDWSKKNCPRILSANNWAGWTQFKKEVEKRLAELKKIDVEIRGKKAEGYLIDGVTYVPVRIVSEKLGARVLYKDGKVYVE
jgi:N-acetylmuramoyl-L-alanine amidase